jgi:hypothetical protein
LTHESAKELISLVRFSRIGAQQSLVGKRGELIRFTLRHEAFGEGKVVVLDKRSQFG